LSAARKKKVLWNTSIGKVEVVQQCYLTRKRRREPSHRIHPLEDFSRIRNKGYSKRCQKLVSDLAIEQSFAQSAQRLKEHHGLDMNSTTVRRITIAVARLARQANQRLPPTQQNRQAKSLVEFDGGMVPLVEAEGQLDRRKARKCLWAELRVGSTQKVGDVDWKYVSSFSSVDDVGDQMRALLERQMGWTPESTLYGIGDGAKWIVEQMERIAGSNFVYTVDLFHLCDYFSGAVAAWTTTTREEVGRLKVLAKDGKIGEVVKELRERTHNYPEHEGLTSCIKYIENRPGQFNYDSIAKMGLPVGSGKIESTNKHLIQKRLKLSGAWWRRENAKNMAELRVLRANGGWEYLWQGDFSHLAEKRAA